MAFNAFTVSCNQYCCLVSKLPHHPKRGPPPIKQSFAVTLWFDSWVGKIPWRRDRLPTPVFMGFLGGSDNKKSSCNVGDLDLVSGSGRSPEEGMATHSSIFAFRIPMDKEVWRATVHGVTKNQT